MPNVKAPSSIVHRPSSLRAFLRRIAFESLYGPLAWAYDWVSRTFFMGQWRVWQRAALPHLHGSRVLEIGMGTGDLQSDLIRAGYEAWGVDFSPQMLRQAVRKAHKRGLPPPKAARARAQALPFPDSCFDSVVSAFPSDYIGDVKTLHEIARVLRRHGRLVVVPGGWLAPRGNKGKFYEGVARVVYGDAAPVGSSKSKVQSPKSPMPTGDHPKEAAWINALMERMKEADFAVDVHTAANDKGAAIVIVASRAVEA